MIITFNAIEMELLSFYQYNDQINISNATFQ